MKLLFSLFILIVSTQLSAQFENLVKWTATFDDKTSEIVLTADLEKSWVIYSQYTDPGGPIPLAFEFEESAGISFIGEVKEMTTPLVNFSEMFELKVRKFKDQAVFRQQVKLDGKKALVKGTVTFMTCDSSRCLPPTTVPFEVKI